MMPDEDRCVYKPRRISSKMRWIEPGSLLIGSPKMRLAEATRDCSGV